MTEPAWITRLGNCKNQDSKLYATALESKYQDWATQSVFDNLLEAQCRLAWELKTLGGSSLTGTPDLLVSFILGSTTRFSQRRMKVRQKCPCGSSGGNKTSPLWKMPNTICSSQQGLSKEKDSPEHKRQGFYQRLNNLGEGNAQDRPSPLPWPEGWKRREALRKSEPRAETYWKLRSNPSIRDQASFPHTLPPHPCSSHVITKDYNWKDYTSQILFKKRKD